MREEVETLLNQKQGPLRPKITFIFDNAAAEQKAIMSKPHKIHVEEQTFRPSFFDRWFWKIINKEFYKKKGVKEEKEENNYIGGEKKNKKKNKSNNENNGVEMV